MSDSNLEGKVVVVTGASSGFGKGAALEFARAGARVVLAARRENLLDELVRECESAGATALAVKADVGVEDHRKVIETDLLGTVYGSYFALES